MTVRSVLKVYPTPLTSVDLVCARCGAGRGEPCVTREGRRAGTLTRNPHAVRIDAAAAWNRWHRGISDASETP